MLALCVVGPAQARLVLTVEATGAVVDGSDSGALTGTLFSVPTDIVSITMTQVFEEDPGSSLTPGFGSFTLASVTFSVTVGATSSTTSFGGGTGIYTIGLGSLSSFVTVTALAGDLLSNVGVLSSTIQLDDLNQTLSFSSGDTGQSVISFGASLLGDYFLVERGTVSVVATHDVPEPSSLLLVALALAACGIRRLRVAPPHRMRN